MGGGGENEGDATNTIISSTAGGSTQRRHRRHQRQRRVENDCPALDLPPTVASPTPQWQPRRLTNRTPQRLCTCVLPPPLRREFQSENGHSVRANFAPCDPLVAFGQYILTVTDDARICIHNIESDLFTLNTPIDDNIDQDQKDKKRKSMDAIAPIAVVDLVGPNKHFSPDFPSIIALSSPPSIGVPAVSYIDSSKTPQNASSPGFLGHITALSSEGCVYVLEFTKSMDEQLKVACVFSWDTDESATCITLHSSLKPDARSLRICLGYENGSICDWEISVPVVPGVQKDTIKRDDNTDSNTTEKAPVAWNIMWRRAKARLLWRGCFDSPIKSVSSIGTKVGNKKEEEFGTNSVDVKILENNNDVRNAYLAVCTLNSTHDNNDNRLKTHSNVEVINIGAIEQDWKDIMTQAKESSSQTGSIENEYVALPLGDYCTWPGAGMEILSTSGMASVNNRHLPRRIHGINSRGTNRVYACHGPKPSFVATLNEGTVALMHAFVNSSNVVEESGELSWGITQEANQLLMSYPCIGVGQINYSPSGNFSSNSAPSNCLACCLRGGTVYVIPILERQTPNHGTQPVDITVFSCEGDDPESNMNYVQGFTAGNIRQNESTPIFIYCWAGGVMDVYASGLLPQKKNTEQTENNSNEVLQELVADGYVTRLLELLQNMNEEDNLLKEDVWRNAWVECTEDKSALDAESLTEDVLNEIPVKFPALQSLLFDLSSESL